MSPKKRFEFAFPDIGEGLAEGKVLELKVQPGQRVKQGQTLAIVETDKVVADIPSPRDGTLVSFGVKEGEIIEVGRTLAVLELEEPDSGGGEAGMEEERSLVGNLETATSAELPPSREGREAAPAGPRLLPVRM